MKLTRIFLLSAAMVLGTVCAAAAAAPGMEAAAPQVRVSGVVVNAQGEAVPGAVVLAKATGTGTMTDSNGKFTVSAPQGSELEVSCIGYKTVTVAAEGSLTIVLEEDAMLLDDVVVVGYGTQKKANLTGSVSTVDVSKTLEAKPVASLGKALQGAVPGLTVLNSNGKIGNEPSIVIRGVGTLSNSATSKPLYIVDGVPIDNISYLNPQDIESISVLKDAASSSIYGTRAAFGVVLITTKNSAESGHNVITYTNNFGWSQATVLPNYPDVMTQINGLIEANNRMGVASELFGMYLDTPAFKDGVQAWAENHKGKALYREMVEGDDYIPGVGYFADWDVARILFNNAAPSQNHTLSVQGNSGKTNYYLSMGYDKEQGLMNFNPDKLSRYNATVNVSTQVRKWIQLGARLNYVYKDYHDPTDALRQGSYQYLWRWGSFFGPWGTINGKDGKNAIAYRKQAGENSDITQNIRLGGFAKITILKGLTLNADYTWLAKVWRYKQTNLPVYAYNTWGVTPKYDALVSSSFINAQRSYTNGYSANLYANYEFTLANDHHFNVMAGFNADESDYEFFKNTYYNLLDYNMPEIALTQDDPAEPKNTWSHSHSGTGSAGFFGRINYNYKGKYLFEANIRRDGSSKFPAHSRWATFPSFSAGWRVSDEPFFEPLKETVNNAKIRASYGTIGNQEVGSNMYLQTIARSANSVNWVDAGATKLDTFGMPKMVSESLTWETIATTNFGIDLGMLNGELNVNLDIFQRDTKGMLAPGQTMPNVLGSSVAYENAGSLRSRGWEITVDWHHNFNGINVYAIGNIADYKTVITEWDNDTMLTNTKYKGKVWGEIWGFETDRYFTPDDFEGFTYKEGIADQKGLESGKFTFGPGDIKFVDQNGDGVIDYGKGTVDDHGDLIVIGNTQPRYQYSLRVGGDWMGFDLDLYFQGVGRRQVWTQSAFVMPMMRGVDALYASQTDYITFDEYMDGNIRQDAKYPRLFPGGAGQGQISGNVIDGGRYNFYPQTKYLVNLAYLRLKTITAGYTVPQKITRKANIEKLRIYGTINNALDIINHTAQYGLDPEINTGEGSYSNGVWGRTDPVLRTKSFGVQVTF